jgi:O-antigen/teichoic acid export membrane protein
MNTARNIIKNSGAVLITRIANPLTSFVFIYFIAKYLGVAGVGAYSAAMSLLIICQAFACLGYQHLITKEVAQDKKKAKKFLMNATSIGICASIVIAGIMCAVVNLITDNKNIIISFYVLSLSLIPYTIGLVCQSISAGFEKFEDVTIAIVSGNAIKLICGIYVLHKGYGLIGLMMVISVNSFIVCGISLYLAIKSISKPVRDLLKMDFAFCQWIIKKVPVFALIFIIATLRMYINIPLLTSMMGEREVGFYDVAYRLVNICGLGIGFFLIAIRPTIFRLYKSSIDKFEFACKESIRYFFIIILPVIAGMTILGERFILLIFSPEFLPAVPVLNILVWIVMINGFNQIIATSLISSDNQKINLKANIAGMISNIVLCFLLIPKFSFIGAGISNIIAAIITFTYHYLVNSKLLFKVQFFSLAKKPLVATILLSIFIHVYKDINLYALIVISVAVYTVFIVCLKTFTTKDLAILKSLWTGRDRSLLKSSPRA